MKVVLFSKNGTAAAKVKDSMEKSTKGAAEITVYTSLEEFVRNTQTRTVVIDRMIFMKDAVSSLDSDELLSDFSGYVYERYPHIRIITVSDKLEAVHRMQFAFYSPYAVHILLRQAFRHTEALNFTVDTVEILRKKYENQIPPLKSEEGEGVYEEDVVIQSNLPVVQQPQNNVPAVKKKKGGLLGLFGRKKKTIEVQTDDGAEASDGSASEEQENNENEESVTRTDTSDTQVVFETEDVQSEEDAAFELKEDAIESPYVPTPYAGEEIDLTMYDKKSMFDENEVQSKLDQIGEKDQPESAYEPFAEEEGFENKGIEEPEVEPEVSAPAARAPVSRKPVQEDRITRSEVNAIVADLTARGVFSTSPAAAPAAAAPAAPVTPAIAPVAGTEPAIEPVDSPPAASPAGPAPGTPSAGVGAQTGVQGVPVVFVGPVSSVSVPAVPSAVPVVPSAPVEYPVSHVPAAADLRRKGHEEVEAEVAEPTWGSDFSGMSEFEDLGDSNEDIFGSDIEEIPATEPDLESSSSAAYDDDIVEPDRMWATGLQFIGGASPEEVKQERIEEAFSSPVIPAVDDSIPQVTVPSKVESPSWSDTDYDLPEPNNGGSAGLQIYGESPPVESAAPSFVNETSSHLSKMTDLEVSMNENRVHPVSDVSNKQAVSSDRFDEPNHNLHTEFPPVYQEEETHENDLSHLGAVDRSAEVTKAVMSEGVHRVDTRGPVKHVEGSAPIPEPEGGWKGARFDDTGVPVYEDDIPFVLPSLPGSAELETVYKTGVSVPVVPERSDRVEDYTVVEPTRSQGSGLEIVDTPIQPIMEEQGVSDYEGRGARILKLGSEMNQAQITQPDLSGVPLGRKTSEEGSVVEPVKHQKGLVVDSAGVVAPESETFLVPKLNTETPVLPSIKPIMPLQSVRRKQTGDVATVGTVPFGGGDGSTFTQRRQPPVEPVAAAPVADPPVVEPSVPPQREPEPVQEPVQEERRREERPRQAAPNQGGPGVSNLRRGSGKAARFIVVTGDRKTGVTSTALDMAAQFSSDHSQRVLFVDYDLKTHGSLLYLGLEDIAQEDDQVQNGIYRVTRVDHLRTSVYPYVDKGVMFDCLLSMYGSDVDEHSLDLTQKVLITQKEYTTVVIDCPFEYLPLLQDVIPYADILICTDVDFKGVLATVLELDRVSISEKVTEVRFASYLHTKSSYALLEGSVPSEFAQNMAQISEYFGLKEADYDWSTLPVVGGAGSLNAAFAAR